MQSSYQKISARVYGFFVCTVVAATSAHAHTFCVNTSTELRDALTAAGNNGGNNHEDNTIRIVRGSYATSGTEFSFTSFDPHTLDINGGYNQDCSTLIENPALTILDGGAASRVFESESAGDVSLRFLTFQNGATPDTNQYGAGIEMNIGAETGSVIVDQNIFRNNHAGFIGGGINIDTEGSGTIQFENNLIVGNTAGINEGGGEIVSDGSGAIIINNTVAQNAVTNDPAANIGGLYIYSSAAVGSPSNSISNNIFWGNSGFDLETSQVLVNNDYLTNYRVAGSGSIGNLNVDPKFFGANDFHLSADSPLRGMGTLTPVGGLPSIDISGLPRQFNNLVDMGAYEYGNEIFKDGFNN